MYVQMNSFLCAQMVYWHNGFNEKVFWQQMHFRILEEEAFLLGLIDEVEMPPFF